MDFNKQLEMQQTAFVQGVRTAVRYELQKPGKILSDHGFNSAVEAVLRSAGWSKSEARRWAEMPEEV